MIQPALYIYANNNAIDQHVHPYCLISTFVDCSPGK